MRSDRMLAAAGAVYVVAMVAGNALTQGGSGSSGPSALAELRHGRTPAQAVGVVLGVLGVFALLVFLGHLYQILRRAERSTDRMATAALGAGLVMTAVDVASAMASVAAVLDRDALTPPLLALLRALNDSGFVIGGYLFGMFVVLAAGSAFHCRTLPRWLAGGGLVVGALAVVAGIAGIVDPARYVPVAYLLCLVWVLVTSVLLALRGSQPVTGLEDGAATASPAEFPATA